MKYGDKVITIELEGKVFNCAMDLTMSFIGGKWKTVILWYLIKEKKRFSEFKKLIPGITERMLSLQLKELEKDGLIKREVSSEERPVKVIYSMTKFGKTLIPILEKISDWGREVGKSKGIIRFS